MNSPRVSVLIPTYNYARYLPEAIESVLEQDFQDFELIIVDDCSTDNTREVVKPFCARDPRVRFAVNTTNLGMVNNWNHCLNQARGEYIKFLFGDDKLWHPQALSKMVGLMERHPSAVLAATARPILDENSKVVDIWRPLAEGCHNGRKVIETCLMQNGKNVVGEPSAVLFRKRDVPRGFDARYQQLVDVEMWFHLLERGDLAYTREALCAFRCHTLQQTERNTASGLGWEEHALFLSDYAVQPWLPRRVVFPILFHLRRSRRKNPSLASPELAEREHRLTDRWGKQWRLYYWLYYIYYRVTKPFLNLRHSVEKRLFRWAASKRTGKVAATFLSPRRGQGDQQAQPILP
jgi:glycosyltransferase involved in cell wall biosynthesis